uniref:Uncharacterized protein n=1 Tax=viral metagenome TaxID=1070528 RepID=A0A6M3KTX5_9ZZZZ
MVNQVWSTHRVKFVKTMCLIVNRAISENIENTYNNIAILISQTIIPINNLSKEHLEKIIEQ